MEEFWTCIKNTDVYRKHLNTDDGDFDPKLHTVMILSFRTDGSG